MSETLINKLDKLVEDSNIYNKGQAKTQKELNEENEVLRNCIENELEDVTVEGTEITVDDAAKYSRNKLELFGNTEQIQYTGKNLFSGWEEGSIISTTGEEITYNNRYRSKFIEILPNTDYFFSIVQPSTSQAFWFTIYKYDENKNYLGYQRLKEDKPYAYSNIINIEDINVKFIRITEIASLEYLVDTQLESGTERTDYEPYVGGVPSPSLDYPQPIHFVTGENSIGVQGKNLFPSNLVRTDKDWLKVNSDGSISIRYDSGNNINFTNLFSEYLTNIPIGNYRLRIFVEGTFKGGNLIIFNTDHETIAQRGIVNNNVVTIQNSDIGNMQLYVVSAGTDCTIKFELEEGTTEPTEYQKYYHADYPINIGNIELCKIGDYQDYLHKENGNWYIQKNTKKTILDKPTTGNLNTDYTYNYFSYRGEPSGIYPGTDIICSHFIGAYNVVDMQTQARYNNSVYWGSNGTYVRVDKFNTVEEYINALSANDITIIGRARTPTTTQITDETLIAQLDEIYEHLKLVKGTNNITITAEDLAPYIELTYKRSNAIKFQKEIDELKAMVIENS